MWQSGHLTISFSLSTCLGFSTTSTIAVTTGSTGSFVILIVGLALDLALALGLTSSLISSFTGSTLLIIYI